MNRRKLMVLAASFAAVALFACSEKTGEGTPASPELKPLTIDEVQTRIAVKDGKTFVYDDNSKESWQKAHVPTAKWLDPSAITTADLPGDKTATLIFYCHNEG